MHRPSPRSKRYRQTSSLKQRVEAVFRTTLVQLIHDELKNPRLRRRSLIRLDIRDAVSSQLSARCDDIHYVEAEPSYLINANGMCLALAGQYGFFMPALIQLQNKNCKPGRKPRGIRSAVSWGVRFRASVSVAARHHQPQQAIKVRQREKLHSETKSTREAGTSRTLRLRESIPPARDLGAAGRNAGSNADLGMQER